MLQLSMLLGSPSSIGPFLTLPTPLISQPLGISPSLSSYSTEGMVTLQFLSSVVGGLNQQGDEPSPLKPPPWAMQVIQALISTMKLGSVSC